jgi:hypothetical protein
MPGAFFVVLLVLLLLGALPSLPPRWLVGAAAVTALRHHVGRVVARRAEKKMARIAAPRVIASVEDVQALGHGAFLQFPSEAVAMPYLASVVELAVSLAVGRALPSPALILSGLRDAGPKLVGQRGLLPAGRVAAQCATETLLHEALQILKAALEALSPERFAAVFANSRLLCLGV